MLRRGMLEEMRTETMINCWLWHGVEARHLILFVPRFKRRAILAPGAGLSS